MIIKKKRIVKVDKYLKFLDDNSKFVLGIRIDKFINDSIKSIFNLEKITSDKLYFPDPQIGIMSRRNAIGEYKVLKNEPKEVRYRAQQWSLKDWGGNTHSRTTYVPYEAYRRHKILPKEFKFRIIDNENLGDLFVINKNFNNNKLEYEEIKFVINLILEIFGKCEVFILGDDNIILDNKLVESVNWEILPKGERIWSCFNNRQINNVSKSEKILIDDRFNYINSFNPTSIKKGLGGYSDYLVFEFKDKNIYFFDSIIYGNAIYVIENDWKEVSKMSKKDILTLGMVKERIIHNDNWKKNLKKYLI